MSVIYINRWDHWISLYGQPDMKTDILLLSWFLAMLGLVVPSTWQPCTHSSIIYAVVCCYMSVLGDTPHPTPTPYRETHREDSDMFDKHFDLQVKYYVWNVLSGDTAGPLLMLQTQVWQSGILKLYRAPLNPSSSENKLPVNHSSISHSLVIINL